MWHPGGGRNTTAHLYDNFEPVLRQYTRCELGASVCFSLVPFGDDIFR